MGMGGEVEGRDMETDTFLLVHKGVRLAPILVDASRIKRTMSKDMHFVIITSGSHAIQYLLQPAPLYES